MKISAQTLREKILGCWFGKNIGGTLGAPFECYRGINDVSFYTQDLHKEPVPNDDLDLQLICLNAVERNGKFVDSLLLSEYWLSFVIPHWSEYGAAKNNLRMEILPPFSGLMNNCNRDSNGAFIRSELWSCLSPGNPNIAVKYMLQDARVDHGGEGIYSSIFCSAIQSAAFIESDINKLINIGLSYIPEDCAIAKAVRYVVKSYQDGLDWKDVRKQLLIDFPSTFGLILGYRESSEKEDDIPEGILGFDAPVSIGIITLALLYGEKDFDKSICLAVNCGEDADCTAATVGATLGIIYGKEGLPDKWIAPIGNKITTQFVNFSDAGCTVPKTIEELTERIMKVMPEFLGSTFCEINEECGFDIICNESELFMTLQKYSAFCSLDFVEELQKQCFTTHHTSQLLEIWVDYGMLPYIEAGKKYTIKIRLRNNIRQQQWLKVKCIHTSGDLIVPNKDFSFSLEQDHGNTSIRELTFQVEAPEVLNDERYEVVLDIVSNGHPTRMFIPITFFNAVIPECDNAYVLESQGIEKYAWKATIKEGALDEYKRRHTEIWPEMKAVLKEAGIRNYTIWNVGNELFGYYECDLGIEYAAKVQSESEVVKRWDEYMKDILIMEMDSETGAQPKLNKVFSFR